MSHIYETAADGWLNWEEDTWQNQYYQILWDYRDKIIFEITGHDHLADFRTHSAHEWYNQTDQCMQAYNDSQLNNYFLGKMISPSITPGNNTNPGFTTFVYDINLQTLNSVNMTFLQLDSASQMPVGTTFDQFEYLNVDWGTEFGLTELSAQAVADLNNRLN